MQMVRQMLRPKRMWEMWGCENGEAVGCSHGQQLFALQGLGSEHHQGDDKQGELLLKVVEPIGKILSSEEPNKVDGCQQEKGLKQTVVAQGLPPLHPLPLYHPIGQQEDPQQVGGKDGCEGCLRCSRGGSSSGPIWRP